MNAANLPSRAAHKRRSTAFSRFWSNFATNWDLLPILQVGTLVLILYGAMVAAFGKYFLPGGAYFTVLLIWAAAHAGGHLLSRALPVFPPLLGMLGAGIILRNVPGGLVDGLPYKTEAALRYGCIAICFLMSGLEADLGSMRKIGGVAVRLLLIPGIIEALVAGGVAIGVFGMTGATGVLFAFALGFIVKPCDPTIVISACSQYQRRGIGVAKQIPSLLVASASFDDIVAIALYTICITLAVPSSSSNKAWDIASAPMQLVIGAALGIAGGLVCAATRVWRTGRLRIAAVIACCLANMFFMSKFHLSGAGVLASIVLGAAVAAFWAAGFPRALSTGPNAAHATVVEHAVNALWAWVGAPLLFGIVGTQCEFRKINGARVPRSLAVIAAGWAARVPATLLSVSGGGRFTWREKVFIALNWLPKATVQSALASAPLDRITAEAAGNEQLLAWGEDALVTALLSVLICGPLAVVIVALGGPRLMTPDAKAAAAADASPPPPAAPTKTLSALEADDKAALAAMPVALARRSATPGGGRARALTSMPNFMPMAWAAADARAAKDAGARGAGGDAPADDADAEEEENDEIYQEALLADVDPDAHALLEEVDLQAWALDAPAAPLSRADAAAAAARLRSAVAGLRRHMLSKTAGIDTAERVDGAREFFRRLAVKDEDDDDDDDGGDVFAPGAALAGRPGRRLRRRMSSRARLEQV